MGGHADPVAGVSSVSRRLTAGSRKFSGTFESVLYMDPRRNFRCASEDPSRRPLPRVKAEALQRIWRSVQRKGDDECWLLGWPPGVKGVDSYGFPRMMVEGKYIRTYKLVYEDVHGEQSEGDSVAHTCRTKMCLNPRHLVGVSREEHKRRTPKQSKR